MVKMVSDSALSLTAFFLAASHWALNSPNAFMRFSSLSSSFMSFSVTSLFRGGGEGAEAGAITAETAEVAAEVAAAMSGETVATAEAKFMTEGKPEKVFLT